MSGGDNIVINTRERAVSDDINDLQDLQYRTLMDMFRFGMAQNQVGEISSATGVRAVVLGGLTVSANGGDITIEEGVLMQDSLTLVPVPGTLDSTYRIGRLGDPLAVSVPSSEGFYLVEVNMVQVTTVSTSRDVFDPGTETFQPTVVTKQTVQTLEATVTFGDATNAPVPTGGDLICIAIVHKDNGGVIDQVIDLRPLRTDTPPDTYTSGAPTYIRNRWLRPDVGPSTGTPSRAIAWDHEVVGRRRMWMSPEVDGVPQFVDFDSAQWATPDAPGVSGQRWVHFHMCEWFGYTPRQAYADYKHQGVLVVDQVNPRGTTSQGSRITQAGIPLPAPFSNYQTLGNGDGVCIGALPYGLVSGQISPLERLSGGYMSDDGHVRGVDDRMIRRTFGAGSEPSPSVQVPVLNELFLNNGPNNSTSIGNPFSFSPLGLRAFDVRASSSSDSNHGGLRMVLMDSTRTASEGVNQLLAVGSAGSAAGISSPQNGGETGYEVSLLVGSAPPNLEIDCLNTPPGVWNAVDVLVTGYWT